VVTGFVIPRGAMSPIGPGAAVGLGVLQGLTEFLPVSSDGHLAIGSWLFGTGDLPLSMVVVVHAGTLLATILVFRIEILALVRELISGLSKPRAYVATDRGRTTIGIVIASVPTAIIGLLLEDRVEWLASIPWVVGVCLLASAAAVALTYKRTGDKTTLAYWQYLLVGVAQGLAVLPGLSRSGSTIACAMVLGLAGPEAFRLSFLLSLPAVAGAVLLELLKPGALAELGSAAIISGATAFVVGLAALVVLKRVVERGKLAWFAFYLVPLGIGVIAWDLAT
jgi:undecaprenyl-diphosphatase